RHGVAFELQLLLVEALREERSVADEGEIRRVVAGVSGDVDQFARPAAVGVADPERRAAGLDGVEEEMMRGADRLRRADVDGLLHGEELPRRAAAARDGEDAVAGGSLGEDDGAIGHPGRAEAAGGGVADRLRRPLIDRDAL